MKATNIHNQAYEFYSWSKLGEDIFNLSQQIIESGLKFDRIIALAKGGLTFSRSLVDFLEVQNISSFQIEFYTGIGTTQKTPVITQSLPVSIRDESVLIFDDIVDRGETMKLAVDYVRHHGTKNVTTASLISKPWADFKVDFSARESQAWVIFPNEVRETITTLAQMWQQKGDSPEVIRQQLLEIGFSQAEVALFFKV
jgi:hypoxanthine phosphoribosyltransferase